MQRRSGTWARKVVQLPGKQLPGRRQAPPQPPGRWTLPGLLHGMASS
jgi:hypothetical protein